jgi:16S rRNA (guanine(966)-N(2))-methyltransferase RsmD
VERVIYPAEQEFVNDGLGSASGSKVRIIAGHARGRKLKAPRGLTTRPATARMRESIFSRLLVRLDFAGLAVLDIFAGSGSLGLEALSRGAAHATFIDASKAATAVIRENLATLGLTDRARIITNDLRRALPELSRDKTSFGLVFVDAPFADDISNDVMQMLADLNLVADDGWVVIRQFKRAPEPPFAPAGFDQFKVATIGDHRIAYYRRPHAGAELASG